MANIGLVRKALAGMPVVDAGNPRVGRDVVIASEARDRAGDIIRIRGVDRSGYERNPIVKLQHGMGAEFGVIGGRAVIEESVQGGYPVLVCREFLFADSRLGQDINRMWQDGILRAASIAIWPDDYRALDRDGEPLPPKSRQEPSGIEFLMSRMAEWSIVDIGMNQDALRRSLDGMCQQAKSYFLIGQAPKGQRPVEPVDGREDCLRLLMATARSMRVAAPRLKGAIPYEEYPVSDEDEWDAAAEVEAASVEDLAVMCAWVDPEREDVKGGYKLPHHYQDGYTLSRSGVTAAMGALLEARGGVSIPEEDVQGVYDHLAAHYEDLDMEAPELEQADSGAEEASPEGSKGIHPSAVARLLKRTSLERCHACRSVVPYSMDAQRFVSHRASTGEVCTQQHLEGGRLGLGPSLKLVADLLRESEVGRRSDGRRELPGVEGAAARLMLAAADVARMSGAAGELLVAREGRVLSAKNRELLGNVITTGNEAMTAMRQALGGIQELLDATDRPREQAAEAGSMTVAEATTNEGDGGLLTLLADPRVCEVLRQMAGA